MYRGAAFLYPPAALASGITHYGLHFPYPKGAKPGYIERAFKAAKLGDANLDLYYNDYNIDQNNAKTTKLVEMVTDFQARNIPLPM